MHRIVEAIVEADGRVRLLEPIELGGARRALLTILDEPAEEAANISALMSEPALSDWSRPEEDEAWSHLQPGL
jgi:uncharacterized protein (DUF1778 family)